MQIDRPIAIAVTLFIILFLLFFLVAPKYNAFKDLQVKLGEEKAEFDAKYEYFSAITKTYYDIQTRQDSIKKIDDALPTDSNLGRLVYFFQKKAEASGIIVKSLFLSKSPASNSGGVKEVKEMSFSFNLVGSYASLENFIISLEKSSRIFEVSKISFSSASSAALEAPSEESAQFQSQDIYSFSLEVKTYTY